jgi:hypothetical protein
VADCELLSFAKLLGERLNALFPRGPTLKRLGPAFQSGARLALFPARAEKYPDGPLGSQIWLGANRGGSECAQTRIPKLGRTPALGVAGCALAGSTLGARLNCGAGNISMPSHFHVPEVFREGAETSHRAGWAPHSVPVPALPGVIDFSRCGLGRLGVALAQVRESDLHSLSTRPMTLDPAVEWPQKGTKCTRRRA